MKKTKTKKRNSEEIKTEENFQKSVINALTETLPPILSLQKTRPYIGTYIYPYLYSENKKELLEIRTMTTEINFIEGLKKVRKSLSAQIEYI